MKLLLVDDQQGMRDLLGFVFREDGFQVVSAESFQDACEKFHGDSFDVVVSDLKLGDGTGLELLQMIREEKSDAAFVLITAYASADSAIEALKYGAFDYVTKKSPFDVEELKTIVRSAMEKRAGEKKAGEVRKGPDAEPSRIIGVSAEMIKIYKTIGVVATTDSTILITGDSGTGKELIAKAIHESSLRNGQPFISVNCGSFPETLLESELFGYMKGSFTGAFNNKKGLFEEANKGTLFLDEIAEMSLPMQVKLLRALQERRVRRLGSPEETPVDVRIIAATNKNLQDFIQKGLFREDLFYRIAVIPIHLPPLRERKSDIPALAEHFLHRFTAKLNKDIKGFSETAMRCLLAYEWKGNVRQLENVVERAAALETSDFIQPERLPDELVNPGVGRAICPFPEVSIPDEGLEIDAYLENMERRIILMALQKTDGVQIKAARLLKITYRSFIHRMHKLGIAIT